MFCVWPWKAKSKILPVACHFLPIYAQKPKWVCMLVEEYKSLI